MIVQDGEIPSTYFSYFWVELEDPSRYPGTATTVLQVPIPEGERNQPGGVGISDLQPFLRPSPEAQEETQGETQGETQDWGGVTERMVDEVDESKRENKMYDLRLELSRECLSQRHELLRNSSKQRAIKKTGCKCPIHETNPTSLKLS